MTLADGAIILNKYRIIRLLGEGGMARVWLAEEVTFGSRQVALKELRADLPGIDRDDVERRFHQEVEVCAALEKVRAPNIVPTYTVEPYEGSLLLVMACMAGGDLADRMQAQRQGMPVEEVLAIARSVLEALQAAHEHPLEIVHRDIKPSNILFDGDGKAHLADFGLAQLSGISGRSRLQGGAHPGSPLYMPPEQASSSDYLTPAADVYALGCVLFEMLAGKRYKRVRPGTAVGSLREGVPAWLDDALLAALAEDPFDRPEDAGELLASLPISAVERDAADDERHGQLLEPRLTGLPAESEPESGPRAESNSIREPAPVPVPEEPEPEPEPVPEPVPKPEPAVPPGKPKAVERAQTRTRPPVPPPLQPQPSSSNATPLSTGKQGSGRSRGGCIVVAALAIVAALGSGLWYWSTLPGTSFGAPAPEATDTPAVTASPLPTETYTPFPTATHTPKATATATPKSTATRTPRPPPTPTPRPASGSTYVNPIDGATYVRVPADEFIMGSDDGYGDEQPVHTVYLDEFWIMRTEVTNAMYAKCVRAAACSEPNNERWDDAEYADHPVTHVSWFNAEDYAGWAGGRLPTEAEWEKACRGTKHIYPWGNSSPNEDLLNYDGYVKDTMPVGSYPEGASPYGALDMAGNVWEWTADRYDEDYYAGSPSENPQGPASGDSRVVRGGSFVGSRNFVRCAFRHWDSPDSRYNNYGFRVVSPGF